MTVEEVYGRVRAAFPGVKLNKVVQLINQAILEEPVFKSEGNYANLTMVEDQRWYSLASDVRSLDRVWYLATDGNYRKIKELIGEVDTGDQT